MSIVQVEGPDGPRHVLKIPALDRIRSAIQRCVPVIPLASEDGRESPPRDAPDSYRPKVVEDVIEILAEQRENRRQREEQMLAELQAIRRGSKSNMSRQPNQPGVSLWEVVRAHCGEECWQAILRREKEANTRLQAAWKEILRKLVCGKLKATGCIDDSLEPQPIAASAWELRWMHTSLPAVDAPSIVEIRGQHPRRITGIRISGRLPAPLVSAERACKEWLKELVQSNDSKPGKREEILVWAKAQFSNLSERGFDRAWKATVPEAWKRPGQRS